MNKMKKNYKIAGITVTMDTFGYAEWVTLPYRIFNPEPPCIEMDIEWDWVKEKHPNMEDSICYLNAAAKKFYEYLNEFDGMVLHSSAVVLDGKAYLFSAQSGTGKSTHTAIWRQVFGDDRVRILNDDKPVIRFENGTWYAYGTPWSGKTTQNLNLKYPIGGIAFLERSEKNKIERYTDTDLIFKVLNQTSRPEDGKHIELLLSHINNLVSNVPFWRLQCNMEPEAAILAYERMSELK